MNTKEEIQVGSKHLLLLRKYKYLYDQFKFEESLSKSTTDEKELNKDRRILKEEISKLTEEAMEEENPFLGYLLLITQLIEENDSLKNKLSQKDTAVTEYVKKVHGEKHFLANNVLESQVQLLYSFIIGMQVLDSYDLPSAIKEYFNSFIDETSEQLVTLQKASIDLSPISMKDLGVVNCIKSYYEFTNLPGKSALQLTYSGSLQRYDVELETQLFQNIKQLIEAIKTNTNTTQLQLHFHEGEKQIICSFIGNGHVNNFSQHNEFIMVKEIIESISGSVQTKISSNNFEITIIYNGVEPC